MQFGRKTTKWVGGVALSEDRGAFARCNKESSFGRERSREGGRLDEKKVKKKSDNSGARGSLSGESVKLRGIEGIFSQTINSPQNLFQIFDGSSTLHLIFLTPVRRVHLRVSGR